jgi:hypothetical protein
MFFLLVPFLCIDFCDEQLIFTMVIFGVFNNLHFNFGILLFQRDIFVGLAYQGKNIVFMFIIEYSSLRDFGPYLIIGLFLYEDF